MTLLAYIKKNKVRIQKKNKQGAVIIITFQSYEIKSNNFKAQD